MLMTPEDNRWAYRAIFVAQYGVAAIGTVFLPFMPEVSKLFPLDLFQAN